MRTRFLVVVAALAMVAVGCVGTADETTTSAPLSVTSTTLPDSTTASTPSTTSAPSTTTTTAVTSSTTAPTTTTTAGSNEAFRPAVPISLAPPEPLPGSDGASGSGCAPGTDTLPDGAWFVFVVEDRPDAIRGDLACFWFGDIAYEVGEAAGEDVANDYYISNVSGRIRTVPVAADAVVWTLAGDTSDGHRSVPYEAWPTGTSTYVACPGEFCIVWLYVNDGVITDIVEQFTP